MGVKCRFFLFDRMLSIEKAKIKRLMFRTFLLRTTDYNFESKPSRNINAVALSDRQTFLSHFFDRIFLLVRHALINTVDLSAPTLDGES